MSMKSSTLGLGVAIILAGLVGPAAAGPSCNTGYSFGAPRSVAMVRPAHRISPVQVSKPALPAPRRLAAAAPQSGGDVERTVVRSPRKAAPKVAQSPALPVEKPQVAEDQPSQQPQQAAVPVEQETTSVSAVAVRLSALAAQQAAAARKGPSTPE